MSVRVHRGVVPSIGLGRDLGAGPQQSPDSRTATALTLSRTPQDAATLHTVPQVSRQQRSHRHFAQTTLRA